MSPAAHQRKKLKQRGRVSFAASVALLLMASIAMSIGLLASPAQATDTVPVPPVPNGMTYDYPCGGDGSGVWTGIPADADFDYYDFQFDNSSPKHLIVVYTNNPIDGRTFSNGTDTYDYGLPADAGMACQPQDQSVTPTEPTVTTAASCDNNGVMTVTPDSQSGAIVWDPSGATNIQPGDSQQFTATAADGYVIPDGAQYSWTKTNNFDTSGCVTTPPADDLVHVKQSSLTDHRNDCGESFATSGQLNVTDPEGVVFEWVKLSDGTVLHASDVTTRTQGNVMQITVPLSEGQYIVDAAIDPPDGWSGQFVLSHYTCSATPPPPHKTKVTPAIPSFHSECGTDHDTYTIPSNEGVEYKVNGVSGAVATAGTHPATGTVTITAEALEGYELENYSGPWSKVFADEPCLGPVPVDHPHHTKPPHHPTSTTKPQVKPNALPHAGWTQAASAAQQTDSSAAMWFLVAAMLGSLSIGSAGVGVIRRRQGGVR